MKPPMNQTSTVPRELFLRPSRAAVRGVGRVVSGVREVGGVGGVDVVLVPVLLRVAAITSLSQPSDPRAALVRGPLTRVVR
jgi:hypothetical protein